jgi:hypothetical protein
MVPVPKVPGYQCCTKHKLRIRITTDPACHFNVDPEPACHSDADPPYHFDADADPDPTFQFDADPDPQPFFFLWYGYYLLYKVRNDGQLTRYWWAEHLCLEILPGSSTCGPSAQPRPPPARGSRPSTMSEPSAQNTSGGSKLDGPSSCDGRHWPPPYGPPVLPPPPPPPEKKIYFQIIGRNDGGEIIAHLYRQCCGT